MGGVNQIPEQTSSNFAAAKVLSILLVVTGHFFDGSLLWIPVTVGLFIFAYSSAYFTAKKYSTGYSFKRFWTSKISRLAVPFWLAQGFLLLLFLATGREGIWTWQTLVHWLGQTGLLNWLAIQNASPFGFGLWFFTLLLFFYLLFPAFSRWNEQPIRAHVTLPVVLFIALLLEREIKVGHALWLTSFAFWFGIYAARYPIGGSAQRWFAVGAGSTIAMLIANILGLKMLNVYLLLAMSMAAVLWIERATIPKKYYSRVLWLTPCVLEVYLIHTYLFIKNDLPIQVRFLLSMILIVGAALILARLSRRLANFRGSSIGHA